ncbi:Insulin receptor substrate 1 [Nymphon striatum]|nr:Insulin receptor substrate 1 [Nymphon striatum]
MSIRKKSHSSTENVMDGTETTSESTNKMSMPESSNSSAVLVEKETLKTGYAKKLKTMKKKFFVLLSCDKNENSRLVYFDSEKKWLNNCTPKRKIFLEDCFSINRHLNSKQRHGITLLLPDDSFTMIFDNEYVMKEWLCIMQELQKNNLITSNQTTLPIEEDIWQVVIKNKGLGSKNSLTGTHRLCLKAKKVTLIKIGNNQQSSDNLEIHTPTISRYGHHGSVFFLMLGRSAVTGAGELWMQTDDTAMAENMHQTFINALRPNGSSVENSSGRKIRPRRSTYSISSLSENASPVGRSISSLNRHDMFDNQPPSTFRQRTASEGQHSLANERPKLLSGEKFNESVNHFQNIGSKPQNFSEKPLCRSKLLSSNSSDESNLQGSVYSKSEHQLSFLGTSLYEKQPVISEENEAVDDYLPLDPSAASETNEYIPMDPSGRNNEISTANTPKMEEVDRFREKMEKLVASSPTFSAKISSEMEESHVEICFSPRSSGIFYLFLFLS